MLSDELREFALTPDRFTRVAPPVERFDDGRFVVIQGTVWAGVAGVRVGAEEVEALVAEVHERVAPEKALVWWIDPNARPADLYDRLLALGLREPRDRAGLLHALVCVDAPPAGPDDVEVTRVASLDDYVVANDVMREAFRTPPERRQTREQLELEYVSERDHEVPVTFVARLDGEAVGVGRSVYSDRGVFIIGGSVLQHARGRGAYRALVRARWDDAVARGTPALVTEAMPDTSYPILTRLGFVDVGTIRRLEDLRGETTVPDPQGSGTGTQPSAGTPPDS